MIYGNITAVFTNAANLIRIKSKWKEDVFMKKALIASLVIGSCLFLPVVHAAGYTDNVKEASKSPMNVGMVYLDMPLSECNYFQQLMSQYSPTWSHQDFPIGRMYTQLTSSYKETLMIEKGTDSVRAITYRLDTKTKADADAAFKTLVQRMKKQLKNVPEEDTEIEVDHAYWHLKDKKADIQVSITPSTYDKTYAYTVRIDRRLENPNHHQLSDTQFQKVLTYLYGDWYDAKGNKAVTIENGQLNGKPIIAAFDLAGATGHAAATYRVKENGTYHDYHMSLRGEGIHKMLIVDKKSYRKTPTPQYGETVGGLYLGMYENEVEELFGKPDSTYKNHGSLTWTYEKKGVKVVFLDGMAVDIDILNGSPLFFDRTGMNCSNSMEDYYKQYKMKSMPKKEYGCSPIGNDEYVTFVKYPNEIGLTVYNN